MLETIYQRRSIRKYTDLPVPGEQVNKLIQAALLAPTSHSGQPWEFIAVDDKELLEQLSYAKLGAAALKNAPLGIVILADTEKSDVWVEDTSIATAFIWLTA